MSEAELITKAATQAVVETVKAAIVPLNATTEIGRMTETSLGHAVAAERG